MNITEAVPLVKQGKKITRQCWDSRAYIYCRVPDCPDDYGIADEDDEDYTFSIDDILANDWKEVGLLSFDELEYNKIYRIESHIEQEIYRRDIVRLALQNQFGAYNSIRDHFALLTIQSDRKIETDGYYLEYAKKLKYREVKLNIEQI